MKSVRAAVVQSAPVVFDRDQTLEKVRALVADATRSAAELIVFPEAFVSGYPRGLDFGARIGSRTSEGRELFGRYWESAGGCPRARDRSAGRRCPRCQGTPGHRRH